MTEDTEVLVCSNCLTASCWYGEFMCEGARDAKLFRATVGQLRKLDREHPENWTRAKFFRVYGTRTPDFSNEPRLP